MLKKSLYVAIISMGIAIGFSANAAETLTKKDVEKIIQQYIKTNGEEINESLQRYAMMEQFKSMIDVVREHTPVQGPDDAPITMVEFSDFECPFCRRVQPTITKLMERYNGRIRYAFKHSPLEQLHPRAIGASFAAQAAHEQGKFWEFRTKIFDRQEFSGEKLWDDVAKEIGLDMKKYEAAKDSARIKEQVAQDMEDAQNVGVRGTPFFLINGLPVSGAQPFESFVEAIERQLAVADQMAK
jgi:protein-disulfide isomerase